MVVSIASNATPWQVIESPVQRSRMISLWDHLQPALYHPETFSPLTQVLLQRFANYWAQSLQSPRVFQSRSRWIQTYGQIVLDRVYQDRLSRCHITPAADRSDDPLIIGARKIEAALDDYGLLDDTRYSDHYLVVMHMSQTITQKLTILRYDPGDSNIHRLVEDLTTVYDLIMDSIALKRAGVHGLTLEAVTRKLASIVYQINIAIGHQQFDSDDIS